MGKFGRIGFWLLCSSFFIIFIKIRGSKLRRCEVKFQQTVLVFLTIHG